MAFVIKNSSTLILPKWFSIIEDLKLSSCMMPRDVTTRWNSTYDMLLFAVTYQEVLNTITGDQNMKLRQYEMDDKEWKIACQLCQVLKVSFHSLLMLMICSHIMSRFSKMQHSFSLMMALQTSQLSFLLWTVLTRFLLPCAQHSIFLVHPGCTHDGEEDS